MSANNQPVALDLASWWQRARSILLVVGSMIGLITGPTAVGMLSCQRLNPPVIVPPVVVPPTPMPEPPGPESLKTPPDPLAAICKIQFGNFGCSATVIGPRLPDGRWQLLSANHCFEGAPKQGVAMFRNGLTLRVVLQGSWRGPDVGWLVTELPVEKLPYAMLSERNPTAGEKIWHAGFGVDNPGNREEGEVVNPDTGGGQTQFRLSVSSGDSGGGIALTADGHVLSPVCCTSAKGRKADVWGGSAEMCRKLRPSPALAGEEWTPIEIPIRMPE